MSKPLAFIHVNTPIVTVDIRAEEETVYFCLTSDGRLSMTVSDGHDTVSVSIRGEDWARIEEAAKATLEAAK